ncbi:phosphoheptose isomerase [Friedmanniella luteola]|uniref:Phosphoheptose isomerase n=1 Tax=Friedmanniella luteola TaxID=546871 RepID=A0A1H1QJ30_9ACTN|nr:SIS domain-containing protein [Friedmanniella luteola]SDS23386.1 phosphoheptose isomerase [Friedmanniella luteola]
MPEPMSDDLTEHVRTAEATAALLPAVRAVAELLCTRFAAGGFLYTLGNGGSAADAQHLTGEMVGRFKRERRPLPAVTLSTDPTVLTCIANDYRFDDVFSRQLRALARPGDVVVAFTTSGRSPDVVDALRVARERGAATVLFGGGDGGPAAAHADHPLLVPSTVTCRIQEMHTFLLHAVSEVVDRWAAGTEVVAGAAAHGARVPA